MFILVAAASALSCAAVAALWVRSYWTCDSVHNGTGVMIEGTAQRVRDRWAASYRGTTQVFLLESYAIKGGFHPPGVLPKGWQRESHTPRFPNVLSYGTWRGFRFNSERRAIGNNGYHDVFIVSAPHWFLVLSLALLPAGWATQYFRERRKRLIGCCGKCGYDLRATPERCPECGRVPAPVEAAA